MIKKYIFLFLICGGLWIAALFGYVQYITQLDGQTRAQLAQIPAQTIVVLTGGTQRIATGARLLQQGQAERMFISGVGFGVRLQDILPNLPSSYDCCVVLGREAHDTAGNAQEVSEWLAAQNLSAGHRVLLVTAHYHLPRALLHLADQMPDVDWLPYAVEPEAFPLDRWYANAIGWRLINKELLKFLYAVLS